MKKKIFSIALLGLLSTLNADVISQNGIAKDSATGLMWQDNNDAKTIKKDWEGAKAYCENLTLGGFSDWRLPNIYELTTLLDNTKSSKPFVIDGIANIDSNYYWSSTTCASFSSSAWYVYFYNGYDDWFVKTNSTYVRCVRAGQLNFDNLVILKNKGKLKVSQENIDKISPNAEAKRKKEAEIAKKKESQVKSVTTRSYNSWKTGYKDRRTDSTPSFSYEATDIKCSDGTNGTVFNYYGRDTAYRYIVNVTNSFKTLDEAANYICGN